MKTKKLLMVLFVLTTAMFYSCGSDDSSNNNGNNDDNPATDDNTPGVPHVMEGNWKTTKFTYEIPGTGQIVGPYDYVDWQVCSTDDELTLTAGGAAKLTETNKNAEDECVAVDKSGTWTAETINFSGSSREVIDVNDTTLKLKYMATVLGANMEVIMEYSKQ